MKYCPMCGTKFAVNAKFCLECGLSVAEYEKKLKRIISDMVNSRMKSDALTVQDKISAKKSKVAVSEPTEPTESKSNIKNLIPEQKYERERLYQFGRAAYFDEDYDVAIDYLNQSADLGEAEAMALLGAVYSNEKFKYCDYKRAMTYHINAVNAGRVRSMGAIGYLYENADVFGKDKQTAKFWYQKEVDTFKNRVANGDTEAMVWLAHIYNNGEIVSQNTAKSDELIFKAATLGNSEAMSILANNYYLKKNYAEGMKWMLKAAEADNVSAIMDIAFSYEIGSYDFPQDYEEAIKWHQRLIDISPEEWNEKIRRYGQKHIDECRKKILERDQADRKNKEILKDLIMRYCQAEGVYFLNQSDKANRKIKSAVSAYGLFIMDDEDILACFDPTILGGAEEGCIITTKALHIYSSLSDEGIHHIRYKNIHNISVRGTFVKDVYVNDIEINTGSISNDGSVKLCDLLNYICQTAIRDQW